MKRLLYLVPAILAAAAWAGPSLPKPMKAARVPAYPQAKLAETEAKPNPWIANVLRYECGATSDKVKAFYIKNMARSGWKYQKDMAQFGVGKTPRANEIGDLMLGTKIVSNPITHHLSFNEGKGSTKNAIVSISKKGAKCKVTVLLYENQPPAH
ncbi:MAG: hypothetical protein IT210_01980 [Armatimonadetes bacterium]|nr:hypothetical protein [Armatimonadota bacterium]